MADLDKSGEECFMYHSIFWRTQAMNLKCDDNASLMLASKWIKRYCSLAKCYLGHREAFVVYAFDRGWLEGAICGRRPKEQITVGCDYPLLQSSSHHSSHTRHPKRFVNYELHRQLCLLRPETQILLMHRYVLLMILMSGLKESGTLISPQTLIAITE